MRLADLLPAVTVIAAVGVTATIAALILANLQSDSNVSGNTYANSTVTNSLQGTQNLTSQLPLIGTVIALLVLAGMAFSFFLGKQTQGTA